MNNKVDKLENETRVQELEPTRTLRRLGIDKSATILDYGCGSGVFACPASQATDGTVYAYDLDKAMIEYIEERIKKDGITNIKTICDPQGLDIIPEESLDYILMSTVYHELDDESIMSFFDVAHRTLKDEGQIIIIEFNEGQTPIGPPPEVRIKRTDIVDAFVKQGFDSNLLMPLGENFYAIGFHFPQE